MIPAETLSMIRSLVCLPRRSFVGFHASLLQDDLSNQVPAPVTKTFSGVVNELMRGENVASNTRADWTPLQVLQQLHENLTELLCGKCQLGMADPCKFGCGRLGLRPISKSLTDVEGTAGRQAAQGGLEFGTAGVEVLAGSYN